MPVRKITRKADRVKVVNWIRSGANLKDGLKLYSTLPYHAKIMQQLKSNPAKYEAALVADICMLMGMSVKKFRVTSSKFRVESLKLKDEKISKKTPEAGNRPGENRKAEKNNNRAFRKQWPFLSRPECPTELKALAADKISCWERYTGAHKKLFDCSSIDECYNTAFELVENYKENRLIHQEFEHYMQHGVVLGLHPVFNQFKKFEHLRGLNVIELVKLHEITLPHRIWRIESELKKNNRPHLKGERENRLNEVHGELAEVKRLLGIK
jgi:hypothetical protein